MKRLMLFCLPMAVAVTPPASAEFYADWSQYDPDPMTIVYPEETSLANPPFVHWQPHPDAESYRVTITGGVTGGPWHTERNFLTPSETMPDGAYVVEIVALDSDGEPLGNGARRSFLVPEATTSYVPPTETITRRADATLFGAPEDIERMTTSGGLTEQYRDLFFAEANKPPISQLDDPKEPERYPNAVWNWQYWSRNNNMAYVFQDRVLALALAYSLTGETQYFEEAKRHCLILAEWDPRGATGVWENDHSAQAILNALSRFYDVAKDDLEPAEREKIAAAIRARCADLYDFLNPFVSKNTSAGEMNDPNNNHPWFVATALGIGAMALLDEEPLAEEWLSFVTQLYWGVFLPHGCQDGGWHEGLDYWSYTLWFVFQLGDALQWNAGIDLYRHPWLENTAHFKIYTHPPVGSLVPFGDSHQRGPNEFDKLIMMRPASQYNDGAAWKYVDAIDAEITRLGRLPYALMWADRREAAPVPGFPFVNHYRDIGWVVSNTDVWNEEDQILFAFRCGPFYGRSFGHTKADLNHFIIAAGGERLIWDSGFYDSYLSPHHRNHARHSIAHNTMLVNGTGQVVHMAGLDGRIVEYEVDGETMRVRGDASKPVIYGGRLAWYYRTVTYEDRQRFIIEDDIFARELSNFTFLLQSEFPITYHSRTRTLEIVGEKYRIDGRFESEEAVNARIVDSFEYPPDPVRFADVKRYRLELETAEKIESWKPRMVLTISRVAEE